MSRRRSPTPETLAAAPELAILAALDHILDLALRALVSAHPQLGHPECPGWARHTSPTGEAADRILIAARHLATALDAYGRAIARDRDDHANADRPF